MARFRADIEGNSYDFQFDGQVLQLDGKEVDHSFVNLGNGCFSLLVSNRSFPVFIQENDDKTISVTVHGVPTIVDIKTEADLMLERFGMSAGAADKAAEVRAPMPGLVHSVSVESGQHVEKGQRVLVLEAMKMENELRAPATGIIGNVLVSTGDAVSKNQLLISYTT